MEVKGRVIEVLPMDAGTSQSGKDWQRQVIVIETDDQYPKKIAVTLFGKTAEHCPKVGETVTCSINIESREWEGKWYTRVQAWRLDVVSEQVIANPTGGGDNDLPF